MKLLCIAFVCLALFGHAHSSALRIINGNEVEPNSIPFQAFLQLSNDFNIGRYCSGVLISTKYVLTTTRCLWGATQVNVTLGAHDVSKYELTKQSYYSNNAFSSWRIDHPEFKINGHLKHNIGLIKLPQNAVLNNAVQTVALGDVEDIPVGTEGTISGWGVEKPKGETVLRSTTVQVVPNDVCAEAYPDTYIGPDVICVKGSNDASACTDDGGLPLVINGKVVGVYSGGPTYLDNNLIPRFVPCSSGKPNIFTKVASYLEWIEDNSNYSP